MIIQHEARNVNTPFCKFSRKIALILQKQGFWRHIDKQVSYVNIFLAFLKKGAYRQRDKKAAKQFFEKLAACFNRKNEQATHVARAGTRKKSKLSFSQARS